MQSQMLRYTETMLLNKNVCKGNSCLLHLGLNLYGNHVHWQLCAK